MDIYKYWIVLDCGIWIPCLIFCTFLYFKVSQNHEGEDGMVTVPIEIKFQWIYSQSNAKLFIENISKILSLMSRGTCSLCSMKLSILLKLKMIA